MQDGPTTLEPTTFGRGLAADPDHAAPSVVDGEVVSAIRRDYRLGRLDATAAIRPSRIFETGPASASGTDSS